MPVHKVLLEHTQAVNHEAGQQLKASPDTVDVQTGLTVSAWPHSVSLQSLNTV